MKEIIKKCMSNAMFSLQKIIPKLETTFFLLSNVVRHQLVKHSSNLPENMTQQEIPLNLSSQFNINATTKYSHTERDSSYTVIHVPRQKQVHNCFFFYFKISKNEELQIQLKQSTTIAYSSYLLTHSQRLNGNFDTGKNHFINISSYFSKRLFDSISTSLNRIRTQTNQNH